MLVTFGICFKQHFDTRHLVFYNPSPPACFCPWTFFQNIGFNMVPSDPFMSHLATLLIYIYIYIYILQGSFRLCNWLSLPRLVSWINHLPPACWSTFWKSIFKHQLGYRFDILDSISTFFLYFDICNYICLDTSYNFWLYLYFWNILYFFKYSCISHVPHGYSMCISQYMYNSKNVGWWRYLVWENVLHHIVLLYVNTLFCVATTFFWI